MTVQVGDKYRTKSGRIAYEVLAIHESTAWLKLIQHPFGVNEDDYDTESLEILVGSYEKIEPFFEVGKRYRYVSNVWDIWTVHSILEQGASKAAASFMKQGKTIHWNILENHSLFVEVND